ncbi:MAG: YdcF family protein [Bacteroidota bacterium]
MGFLKFIRGFLILLAVFAVVMLLGIVFKTQILTGLGNYLVYEDEVEEVDAAFILAGLPTERIPLALQYYKEEKTPLLVAVGELIDPDLEILNYSFTDAEVASKVLYENGVDSSQVVILNQGTSTYEESEAILAYSRSHDLKKIMVISSKFHTRRIRGVFKKKFKEAGIEVVIRGAEPSGYEIEKWWLAEQGLIFVNNEYVKLVYYWLNY